MKAIIDPCPIILIHIDDRRRDALTLIMMGKILQAMGNSVFYCNRSNHLAYRTALQPDVLVLPYVWMRIQSSEELANLAKKTKIIILPTEGLYSTKGDNNLDDSVLADFVPGYYALPKLDHKSLVKYTKYTTKILMWGRFQRDACINMGLTREDQVSVVGAIRTDLFRDELILPNISTSLKYLGFVGRFDVINVFDQRPIFELVDGFRKEQGNQNWDEDRELEDLYWSHYAYLRLYLTLLEKSINKRGHKISYRPNPFESFQNYTYLRRKYGQNFIIDKPLNPLAFWLRSLQAVIFSNSTVGLEAMLLGKPVITVHSIIKKRFREQLRLPIYWMPYFTDWCWLPKSIDEAMDLLDLAVQGKLSANYLENPEFKKYVKDNFDWPRREPSVYSAAKIIDRTAKIAFDEKPGSFIKSRNHRLLALFRLTGDNVLHFCHIQGLRLGTIWNKSPKIIGKVQIHRYSNFYPWYRYEYRMARQLYPILARLCGLDDGKQ